MAGNTGKKGRKPAQKQAAQRPEAPSSMYSVRSTDIESEANRRAALSEFTALQNRSISTSYLEWAKHEVRYDQLESDVSEQKLRQANDAYTMSMVMNVLGPLQNGISVGTLMQSWMSYKLISAINPGMEADMSRLCSNLRESIRDMSSHNPAFAPALREVDGWLSRHGGDKLACAIGDSMDSNSLDSMVLTPKQVAALKVNFMEQYYVDMRTKDGNRADMKRSYDAAIGHLAVIAHNSGFDMAVVAAEERYIVGVKMRENPAYANIFSETSDIYGSRPVYDEDGMWSGKFETGDGHEYTVGGSMANGAFTVREPYETKVELERMDQGIYNRGQQCQYMRMWLESDDCPLGRRAKSHIRSQLDDFWGEYQSNSVQRMEDDGVPSMSNDRKFGSRAASQRFDANFNAGMSAAKAAGTDDPGYQDFVNEMHRIIDKEVLTKAGVKVTNEVLADVNAGIDNTALSPLKSYMEQRATEHKHDPAEVGSGIDIALRLRYNYIASMTDEELGKLMIHTGTNQEQGYNRTGGLGPNVNRDTPSGPSAKPVPRSRRQRGADPGGAGDTYEDSGLQLGPEDSGQEDDFEPF